MGHEEETVIPKHTIHCFGQAGMSRRNRSSFVERKEGSGEARGVEQEQHEVEEKGALGRSSEVSL